MKIWHQFNGTEETFCDHGREGPSNFVPQVMRKKDILSFVQGTFAKPMSRGNAYRVWRFSVTKVHDSIADAEKYLITLHQTVPAQTDVYVELNDTTTRYLLPDCCVDVAPAAPSGVKTTVTYTLTFGVMNPMLDALDSLGVDLNDSEGVDLWTKEAAE